MASDFIPREDDTIIIEDEPVISKKTTQAPNANKNAKEEKKATANDKNIINNEKEAAGFMDGFLKYITNPGFDKKIVEEAQSNGLDPRQVANSFATKILGTISDLSHLALDTVGDAFATLISVIAGLLIKGGELLIRVAKRIVRIVTLNKTAKGEN